MNDGIIAFHELVRIRSWADSSTRGPSIKVELRSRDSLAAFEKITKRAGKRAGQRFASVWQYENPEDGPEVALDLWFAGANWSHQDGASVKFSVSDLDSFRDGTLPMEEGEEPVTYWLTLVQIDDDEKPIDQKKAERVEEGMKGGPKSKRVAMLTQQRDFQAYVTYRTNEKIETAEAADAWVKAQCGVASKREFDHNADAWSMFEARVMSPFIRWGEGSRWSDEGDVDCGRDDEHPGERSHHGVHRSHQDSRSAARRRDCSGPERFHRRGLCHGRRGGLRNHSGVLYGEF